MDKWCTYSYLTTLNEPDLIAVASADMVFKSCSGDNSIPKLVLLGIQSDRKIVSYTEPLRVQPDVKLKNPQHSLW